MDSVFTRVYSLLRYADKDAYEDFLTEIFAEVLQDEEMLVSFLSQFARINVEAVTHVNVQTQRTFSQLPNHQTDSRPDLVIQFSDGNQPYIVFIENKLGSGEGELQLQRYADHLRVFRAKGVNTLLLFVTQFYDPKDENYIFSNGRSAEFVHLRWYQIYAWLQTKRNAYIDKVLEFMEEIKLDETRCFVPQDIYAIQNLNRLLRMMDECLDGSVEEEISNIFGKAIGWSNRSVQLRDHSRYFKVYDQRIWWVGCGFYLTEDTYPVVSVILEIAPNYPERDKMVKAMKSFIGANNEWRGQHLDDTSKWTCVYSDKLLLNILPEGDHIKAIQDFFVKQLKAVYSIKQQNPSLPW